ncbi:MAG: hypothetical protein RSD91_06925 [Clostridiales bacterium]
MFKNLEKDYIPTHITANNCTIKEEGVKNQKPLSDVEKLRKQSLDDLGHSWEFTFGYVLDATGSMNRDVEGTDESVYDVQIRAFISHLKMLFKNSVRLRYSVSVLRNNEIFSLHDFVFLNESSIKSTGDMLSRITPSGSTVLTEGILVSLEKAIKEVNIRLESGKKYWPAVTIFFSDFETTESEAVVVDHLARIEKLQNDKEALLLLAGTEKCEFKALSHEIARKNKHQMNYGDLDSYLDDFFRRFVSSINDINKGLYDKNIKPDVNDTRAKVYEKMSNGMDASFIIETDKF